MPKLKKYSELKRNQEQEPSNRSSRQKSQGLKEDSDEEDADFVTDDQYDKKNKKMRRSSRKSEKRGISKKQQKEDARKRADEVLKNMTDEFANNENSNSNGSGYIPIQVTKQTKKRKSRKKEQNNTIRVKNRFFDKVLVSEANFQTDIGQPQIQLQVKKKSIDIDQNLQRIKSKFDSKADKLKKRLSYKDYRDDSRYKEDVKKTINDVRNYKEDDNINIVLEMPKIFTGPNSKQANAALFLKNSQFSQHSHPQEKSKVETKQQNIDNKQKVNRKSFYSEFRKEINEKRAVQLEKKDYFKQSTLDDFDKQFNNHEHLFQQNSNGSFGNSRKSGQNSRVSNKSIQKSNDNLIPISHSRNSLEDIPMSKNNSFVPTPVKQVIETSNSIQEAKKEESKPSSKTERQKAKKNMKQVVKKQKNKMLKDLAKKYIEEQAEHSDASGYGINESQSEDDNSNISSLIDHSFSGKYDSKQEANVLKFINQQEQQKHEKMLQNFERKLDGKLKHKIQQENSASIKRKRRIREAKKKFSEQDGTDHEIIKQRQHLEQKKQPENPIDLNEFEAGLKRIQAQTKVSKANKNSVGKKKRTPKKTNIWNNIKLNERKPAETKRGGFINNPKSITGSRIHSPKRKSKESKKIIFQHNE